MRVSLSFQLKKSERVCIDALTSGLTQQQAAVALGIHIRTLEENLRGAKERLGLSTTYQLIALATHFEQLGSMWLSTIDKYPQKEKNPVESKGTDIEKN